MKKYLIKVNGTQYEVEVEEVKAVEAAKENAVPVKTAPAPAAAPAPRPAASAPAAPAAGGSQVKAPMPGTIIKVNVSVGDAVKKGQVLLVLEAMKMENEITAPVDGKIAAINVEKGKSVNAGDLMVSIG